MIRLKRWFWEGIFWTVPRRVDYQHSPNSFSPPWKLTGRTWNKGVAWGGFPNQDFPAKPKELIRIYRSPELLAHLSGKKGVRSVQMAPVGMKTSENTGKWWDDFRDMNRSFARAESCWSTTVTWIYDVDFTMGEGGRTCEANVKGGELRFLKTWQSTLSVRIGRFCFLGIFDVYFGVLWKVLGFWGVVCIGSFCVAFLGLWWPNVFNWGVSFCVFFRGRSLPWHNSNPNIGGQHLTADMLSYLLNFLVGMS